jgi:hypothetical protein
MPGKVAGASDLTPAIAAPAQPSGLRLHADRRKPQPEPNRV